MPGRKSKITTDKSDRKYQRDRTKLLKDNDATLADLDPTPPTSLVGVAATAYTKIVNDLNAQDVIKEIDVNVVIALARQIQLADSAYKRIYIGVDGSEPEGIQQAVFKPVLQGGSGGVIEQQFLGFKKNPAVSTLDAATAKIKSLSETLGMTPSSRASLLSLSASDEGDDDDIKKIMNSTHTDF